MSQIEQIGTYRGSIVEHGVGVTSKSSCPQWIAKFIAMEKYNNDTGEWEDFSQFVDNEITAYLVLFGKDGETLTCKQVCKATGWDGSDFQELDEADLSAVGVQVRVAENTYEGKTRLQVEWIDEYDAVPGNAIKKLSPDEIKLLNAKFKKYMKPKKVTPATAKPKDAPKPPKKGTVKVSEPLPEPVSKLPPGVPELVEAPLPKSAIPEGKCTQTEAYDGAYSVKAADITDQQFNDHWFAAIESVTGAKTYDGVIDEQWFHIKEKLMEATAAF